MNDSNLPAEDTARAVLRTLLVSDLVGSTALVEQLGDERAFAVFGRHDRLARDVLKCFSGREIDKTDGFLLLFERPIDAVLYAAAYHQAMRDLSESEGIELASRVGIHLGEVYLRENSPEDVKLGAKPIEVEGLAKPMTARIMSVALGGQTLLSQGAFDLARRAAAGGHEVAGQLSWIAHGAYVLKGVDEPVPIFEVGREGVAPLTQPLDSEKVHRVAGEHTILGWRPAPAQEIPLRPHWRLERKLGEGGFGEVWLASNSKTRDRRVFKFCFEADRLRALQREVTLFRLLKETLGNRDDIARILDWNFDEAPFFVESEFTEGGSLIDWAESEGGIAAVPLEVRLEIVAQVAVALSAAHSVGVLHKDIKPGNILITRNRSGNLQTRLTDFGIGLLTDAARLSSHGITNIGFTATEFDDPSSSGGTFTYMAPELLEGKVATVQADIYALGVLCYQFVVGSFERIMAPGWEREVDDEILGEDIASMVDGSPDRRRRDAAEIAARLRSIEARRREREAQRRAQEANEKARILLEKSRRRRKIVIAAGIFLILFSAAMTYQARRIAIEAKRANLEAENARQVAKFLVSIFEVSDLAEGRGETVTARELLDEGARKAHQELGDQPLTRAVLLGAMGTSYLQLGLYTRAAPLLEESLLIREKALGADHPLTDSSRRDWAVLAAAQGRYDEAEAGLKSVLTFRETAFGPDHELVAEVLDDLTKLYRTQGRHAEALPLARRAERIGRVGVSHHRLDTVQRPSETQEILAVGRSMVVPGDVDMILGSAPGSTIVFARGSQGVYQIDFEGKVAPILNPVPENGTVLSWILRRGPVVRIGSKLVVRNLFKPGKVSEDVLASDLRVRDSVHVDRYGRRLVVMAGQHIVVRDLTLPTIPVIGEFEAGQRIDHVEVSDRFVAWVGPDGVCAFSLDSGENLIREKHWAGIARVISIDDPAALLAVGGWFDEVAVYDLENPPDVDIVNLSGQTRGLCFLPDHPTLVVCKDGLVGLWRPEKGVIARFEEAGSQFGPAQFESNGLLVFDSNNQRLRSFDYCSFPILEEVEISSATLWTIATDANGSQVFAGASDGRLHRYDLTTGELKSVVAHTQGVTSMVCRPGAVITGGDDKMIIAWDSETLEEISRTRAHENLVNFLNWEERANRLWSSSSDGTVKAWSWPGLQEIESLELGGSAKAAFWVNSDSGMAVLGTWNGFWLEARRSEHWAVTKKVEVGSRGVYAAVALEPVGVVFLLGVYPSSSWAYDLTTGASWRLEDLDMRLLWATPFGDGSRVVCPGEHVVAIYRFSREDGRLEYELSAGLNTGLGELAVGASAYGGARIAVGTADGRLLILDSANFPSSVMFSDQLAP